MNRKGFTFVELLAVIVLIGIIIGISVPVIRYADKKFHEKAYNTKVDLIKNAAKDYGDENIEFINAQTTTYTEPSSGHSYKAVTITVGDLLDKGYITKDNDIRKRDVLDPRNDESMLDKTITVYIKYNRAYVKLNF